MSLTHSDWLANRRKYLGGSDAAPAIGKSQWRTPRDVYFSKVEGVHDEPTDAMRRGLELEPLVAHLYKMQTGNETLPTKFMVSKDVPFMAATPDLPDITDGCLVQLKTSSTWNRDKWGNPHHGDYTIPGDYMIQCQHEMAVCDAPANRLAVLFCSEEGFHALRAMIRVGVDMDVIGREALKLGEYQVFPVMRNDEMIQHIIEEEKAFWETYVVPKIPPEDPSAPQKTSDIREPETDELEMLRKAEDAYRGWKLAELRWQTHKAELQLAIGQDSGIALPEGGKVTWKAPAAKVETIITIDWEAISKWACVFKGIKDAEWKAKIEEFTTEEKKTTQRARVLRTPRGWGKE